MGQEIVSVRGGTAPRWEAMQRFFSRFATVAVATFALTGCGGVYSASGGSRFALDSAHEINDEDVAKAFAANPQIGEKVKVAYYTFDDKKADDVERQLAKTKNVASVYRIPPLLVTGQRRFQESGHWAPPQEVGTKKLRLLAARAHADVLVIFDHGWRGGGANGWAALTPLIVPIFFTPWLSNETESYAQAWVLDVRNGYLYGEVATDAKSGGDVTIYGPSAETVAEQQWPKLLEGIGHKLEEKLAPTPVAPAAVAPAGPAHAPTHAAAPAAIPAASAAPAPAATTAPAAAPPKPRTP